MALDLSIIASEMARAIELTMDPSVPQQQRMQAYTAYEEFKENSPLCAQCGFYMAQNESMSHYVRHFGLQLIEHCVKYRWNQLIQEEKLFIKENAMKLLYAGVSQEESHIKDALSRVVVEMVKREWPQQWPNLLTELSDACKLGETQTELVLLVFLRLVEDVVILKTFESSQRRKDIYQALMSSMSDIFLFFLKITEENCNSYQLKVDLGQTAEAAPHLRVVHVALKTLTGFVEWVTMTHIMVADGRLLQILCLLLARKEFKIPAAECLVQIVNRRGRLVDRKPLLILFSEDALQCMLRSLECVDDIVYLKLLAQVLVGLGGQLCWLWDKENGAIGRPLHFKLFLSITFRFTEHPNITLVHIVNALWLMFMKNSAISKDIIFMEFLPRWLQATTPKIIKPSYSTDAFLCKEYSTEEDFDYFFRRFRHDVLDALRQAMLIHPLMVFSYLDKWLMMCLVQQTDNSLEWGALSAVMECVLASIKDCLPQPIVDIGLRLLVACLNYNCSHPKILSAVLSCISSLFIFVSAEHGNERLLLQVLEKIFGALVFITPGRSPGDVTPDEKNLHTNAANLMVKLSRKHPQQLLPLFDQILGTVQRLSQEPNHLSWRDKIILQEALLILSNHFCDYDRQTRFIKEMVSCWNKRWLDLGSKAFKGPQEFMNYIGLDQPPVELTKDSIYSTNRSNVHCCVTLLLIVIKYCAWPDDMDRAIRGGFCSGDPPVFRNPAAPHIIPLLPTLLALFRVLNGLWTPTALAILNEGFRPAYSVLVVDRTVATSNNLSITDVMNTNHERSKTPVDRMRILLTTLYDNSCHILGAASANLRQDFYGLVGLAPSLIDSVFSNLDGIPDYRLRPVVQKFLKPLVSSCPPQYYESVLLPVLGSICPFVYQRLDTKWQFMTQQLETEESSEQQEVTEDLVTRMLTRDFVELLKLTLVGTVQQTNTMDQDDSPRFGSALHTKVSDLGGLVLHQESTCQSVVLGVFRALSWNDTNASMTATWLAAPLVKKLLTDGNITPPVASYIITSILQGLQVHGQHDTNSCSLFTLGIHAYEMLRPDFPNIVEVMMQIPGCSELDLKKLDEKVLANRAALPPGAKIEKSKRDAFVKVTNKLVGRSLGQLFRKEVSVPNLPRLQVPERPKQLPLDEQLKENETLCAVFQPSRS